MEIAHRDDVGHELRVWWDALCRETTEAMQEHCLPYVTPISHAINNDYGELKGTGGYLEFAGERWLVSNEHVLCDWQTRQFTHQFQGCGDVFRLVGAPTGIEKHPVDAAIWHIPDDVWNALPRPGHHQLTACSKFARFKDLTNADTRRSNETDHPLAPHPLAATKPNLQTARMSKLSLGQHQ